MTTDELLHFKKNMKFNTPPFHKNSFEFINIKDEY